MQTNHSPIYLRRVKRFTEMVKRFRGVHRVPAPLPRPGSPAHTLSNNLSAKDAQKRQEDYVKQDRFRLDKVTIAFFAVPYSLTSSKDE